MFCFRSAKLISIDCVRTLRSNNGLRHRGIATQFTSSVRFFRPTVPAPFSILPSRVSLPDCCALTATVSWFFVRARFTASTRYMCVLASNTTQHASPSRPLGRSFTKRRFERIISVQIVSMTVTGRRQESRELASTHRTEVSFRPRCERPTT